MSEIQGLYPIVDGWKRPGDAGAGELIADFAQSAEGLVIGQERQQAGGALLDLSAKIAK